MARFPNFFISQTPPDSKTSDTFPIKRRGTEVKHTTSQVATYTNPITKQQIQAMGFTVTRERHHRYGQLKLSRDTKALEILKNPKVKENVIDIIKNLFPQYFIESKSNEINLNDIMAKLISQSAAENSLSSSKLVDFILILANLFSHPERLFHILFFSTHQQFKLLDEVESMIRYLMVVILETVTLPQNAEINKEARHITKNMLMEFLKALLINTPARQNQQLIYLGYLEIFKIIVFTNSSALLEERSLKNILEQTFSLITKDRELNQFLVESLTTVKTADSIENIASIFLNALTLTQLPQIFSIVGTSATKNDPIQSLLDGFHKRLKYNAELLALCGIKASYPDSASTIDASVSQILINKWESHNQYLHLQNSYQYLGRTPIGLISIPTAAISNNLQTTPPSENLGTIQTKTFAKF